MQSGLEGYFFRTPVFYWQGEILKLPTRKATALLCYLSVQRRAVQREELTELLWKQGESRNLRRELYRLKQLPGAESWLEIDEGVLVHVTTDLSAFIEAVEQQDFQQAIKLYQGKADEQLLAGLEPKNAPVFMDWLESKREELNTLLIDALQKHTEELESSGKLVEATELTRQLLEQDPLNESTHRAIMRQEFKLGNLPAALKQYEVCRHVLAKELDITPLPETLALAQEIEKAAEQPLPKSSTQARIKTRHRIPPKLLRPPVLVGRESEWTEMEKAWQAGKTTTIAGTAGSGKTRLMMDFARSKSDNFGLTYGRPGDKTVPYSSLARSLRLNSNSAPNKAFEPWVRYELARIAPELFEEKPLPMSSPENRILFSKACVNLFTTVAQIFDTLLTDDLHYFDEASFFMGSYAFSQVIEKGLRAKQIACYRKEEIPPEHDNHLIELAEKGFITYINLTPLDIGAVTKLLISLEIQQPEQLAPHMHKLTGGNPQFIVEVLKSLYEQGWQGPSLPEQINLPKQVSSTIEKRLNYLSPDALKLARAMAVLKEHSGVQAKQLAEIIDMDYLKASEMLAELEQAYIIKDGLFVHDLLFEATLSSIPVPIYTALNHRAAKWLEAQDVAPARIAHHWIEANEPEQALPWRVRGAEVLLTQGEAEQAHKWLEEVLKATDPESDLYKQARVLQYEVAKC